MGKIKVILTRLAIINFLLYSLIGCTKDTSPDNKVIDPYLDGWTIETKKLNIDVHPTSLLFTSPSDGFIIGYNGAIFHTSDSGNTWSAQNSSTILHLNSIFFLNQNIGFISGIGMNGCLDPDCNKGSILLRTTDGGNNWTKMFYDSLAYLESMQFRDENNGIAIMETYHRPNSKFKFLVKTINGGTSWIKTNLSIPQSYSSEIINKENVYYIIGTDNKILKSTDFGDTWQSINTPVIASNDLFGIYFINKDIGFISDGTKAYKTVNGGQTWHQVNDLLVWFEGIHFVNENEGFNFSTVAVYDGGDFPTFKGTYIFSTKDGGETFNISELFTKFYLGLPCYPAPNIGYAINLSQIHKFIKK
jgi:photosystem II stability/assembly factor-like uncharacterized protein